MLLSVCAYVSNHTSLTTPQMCPHPNMPIVMSSGPFRCLVRNSGIFPLGVSSVESSGPDLTVSAEAVIACLAYPSTLSLHDSSWLDGFGIFFGDTRAPGVTAENTGPWACRQLESLMSVQHPPVRRSQALFLVSLRLCSEPLLSSVEIRPAPRLYTAPSSSALS